MRAERMVISCRAMVHHSTVGNLSFLEMCPPTSREALAHLVSRWESDAQQPGTARRCPTGTWPQSTGSSDTFWTPTSPTRPAKTFCLRVVCTSARRADCIPPGSASSTWTSRKGLCSHGCWPVCRSSTQLARPCWRPSSRGGALQLTTPPGRRRHAFRHGMPDRLGRHGQRLHGACTRELPGGPTRASAIPLPRRRLSRAGSAPGSGAGTGAGIGARCQHRHGNQAPTLIGERAPGSAGMHHAPRSPEVSLTPFSPSAPASRGPRQGRLAPHSHVITHDTGTLVFDGVRDAPRASRSLSFPPTPPGEQHSPGPGLVPCSCVCSALKPAKPT